MEQFTKAAFLVLLFSASLAWGAGPTYIPVVNGQFFAGQDYFEGDKSSLAGNASLTFVPALRYSNRFSVLPTFESSYRGTRSAQELADGSNIFQDTWENNANVKLVHGLSPHWKLKEFGGIRMKWLRETSDEKWNDGLYDYRILDAGFEVEHQWNKSISLTGMYDYSYTRFPNYESLEATQGDDMAREYAGKDVMDTRSHLFSVRGNAPLVLGLRNFAQAYFSPRFYTDQHIVEASGLLSASLRKDQAYGVDYSVDRPFRTGSVGMLTPSLRYAYSRLNSDQNHYDAKQTVFIGNFYDYVQNQVGVGLAYAFTMGGAGPMGFEGSYTYSHRVYSDRPIQDASSAYLTDKLYVNESTVGLSFIYPIAKNLHLRVSSMFGRSRSNNDYEQLYRYNYSTANYLFGFVYDY